LERSLFDGQEVERFFSSECTAKDTVTIGKREREKRDKEREREVGIFPRHYGFFSTLVYCVIRSVAFFSSSLVLKERMEQKKGATDKLQLDTKLD